MAAPAETALLLGTALKTPQPSYSLLSSSRHPSISPPGGVVVEAAPGAGLLPGGPVAPAGGGELPGGPVGAGEAPGGPVGAGLACCSRRRCNNCCWLMLSCVAPSGPSCNCTTGAWQNTTSSKGSQSPHTGSIEKKQVACGVGGCVASIPTQSLMQKQTDFQASLPTHLLEVSTALGCM